MTTALMNAAPKAILNGIRDNSAVAVAIPPEQIPTHLPHVFLFTSEGPLEPQLVVGGSASSTFGNDVFGLKTKYTTHQTVLASIFNANGNSMIIQRLKPTDANDPATLTLSLEVVEAAIQQYERNTDGTFKLNQDGQRIPLVGENEATKLGHKARWIVSKNTDQQAFGVRTPVAGALSGNPQAQSTIYPIMDLEVANFGEHGNLKGIRLWAPTARSVGGADEATIELNRSFVNRIQLIKKPDARSQPAVVTTIGGSQAVDFSFKPGSVNAAVGSEIDFDTVFLDSYRNMDARPVKYGPFNRAHVYHNNVKEICNMIFSSEMDYQPDWSVDTDDEGYVDSYMVNLIGGENVDGAPYYTFELLGRAGGGVDLTANSNHYASGGSDGTINNEQLNLLVANICSAYPFKDMAYWPQSAIWDSGFSMSTKMALLPVLGMRKDVFVVLATQDVDMPQNSSELDSSAAMALQAAARAYPESELYGTSTCRAVVVGQSGKLANSVYKGLLPLSLDFAHIVSRYMGAGDGRWKANYAIDVNPNNVVTLFKADTVNHTYKDPEVYAKDWDNGLIWAQTFDRSSLFYPQTQTVYPDATSILNSFINMVGMVEAEKVCHRVWARLTGRSDLTAEQFIERSDALIAEMMAETRFNNRFIIRPVTEFTDIDAQLGYAWTTTIQMYGNNMMTVGSYTIESNRRANFAG